MVRTACSVFVSIVVFTGRALAADGPATVDMPAAMPAAQSVAASPVGTPLGESQTPVAAAAAATTSAAPAAPHAAAASAPTKPAITLAIDIDLTRQRMTLTEYGKLVGSWPISSGAQGHRSPTGTFRPLWTARMWYSKKYDNAPMPHAVFFNGGVAMHATQSIGMLGRPASHGCIRQSPANAATTYKLVEKHGFAATRIVVHGAPRDDEARVARREAPATSPATSSRHPVRQAAMPAPAGMRRVILVDGDGNRRIAAIPANDPRLVAYYRQQRRAYD